MLTQTRPRRGRGRWRTATADWARPEATDASTARRAARTWHVAGRVGLCGRQSDGVAAAGRQAVRLGTGSRCRKGLDRGEQGLAGRAWPCGKCTDLTARPRTHGCSAAGCVGPTACRVLHALPRLVPRWRGGSRTVCQSTQMMTRRGWPSGDRDWQAGTSLRGDEWRPWSPGLAADGRPGSTTLAS